MYNRQNNNKMDVVVTGYTLGNSTVLLRSINLHLNECTYLNNCFNIQIEEGNHITITNNDYSHQGELLFTISGNELYTKEIKLDGKAEDLIIINNNTNNQVVSNEKQADSKKLIKTN